VARKARIGRPPRTDDPTAITLLLPGALKRWLRGQAAREGRGMGAVVADGLRLYEVNVTARLKQAGRRDSGKT